MKNQRSWRLMSELKPTDTTVRVSKVIGKKDEDGNTFFPTIEYPTTVVLMSEDKKTFETCKATADGQGNLTFTKRGLSDDKEIREVESFKLSWLPGTYMFMTMGAGDLVATTEPNTWTGKQTFEDDVEVGKDLVVSGKIIHPNEMIFQDSKNGPLTLSQIIHVAGEGTEVLVMTEEDYEKLEEPRLGTIYLINDNGNIKKAYLSGNEYLFLDIIGFPVQTVLAPDSVFVVADEDGNKKITAETLFQYTNNSMGEPTNLALELIDNTHLGVKYKDPVISTPSIRTIPDSANDWLESYIIRKEGTVPSEPEDGVILNTSTTKNEYENSLFSSLIEEGKDYYYRIVSKADNGVKTYGDYIQFSTKYKIDFLLIGGGGGGGTGSGYNKGGGGGAGGVIYKQNTYLSALECPVVIGGGGNSDTDGEDSSFIGYVAKGGGGGGGASGNNGGSGGGGGGNPFSGPNQGGTGTTGQGNNGGNGYKGEYAGGGGGGGAGGVGGSGGRNSGGTGGIGIENDISGTLTQYAGGGGGGGSGSYGGGDAGQDATTYGSGGGGGSPWSSTVPGGKGKQGILIIRYLTASGITATGGTITTSGNYTIHTFTSNGTFTVIE